MPRVCGTAGLVALELVVPVFWVSDWRVERHHTSIFDIVFQQRLGTRPVDSLDGASRERLVRLAEQKKLEARKKASEEGRDVGFPPTSSLHPALQALVWVFTPPSEGTPVLQVRLPRKGLNKFVFQGVFEAPRGI
jgi:hypothetical protein